MRISFVIFALLALPAIADDLAPPLPGLLRQLEEQDGNRRLDAAKELGLLGRKEAAEPLYQRLGRERVTQVAGAIALALDRLADPRGRRALDGWLDSYDLSKADPDAGFRADAAAEAAAEGKLRS